MARRTNGSLLTQDRAGTLLLRPAPEDRPRWRLELGPVAIVDAVVGVDTLPCGARSRLWLVDSAGAQQWVTPVREGGLITCLHPDPTGTGWLCLDVTPGGRGQSARVLRVNRDGDITVLLEVGGSWIGFVNGGHDLIAEGGTVVSVMGSPPAP